MQRTNWAGNVTFAAARFHEPTTVDELQRLVAASRRSRVVGTGHSFNRIADSREDLIFLRRLPARIDIDDVGERVTVSAGTRYGELSAALHANGWALTNLGSLPHISVAGAVATATHGSGDENGNLATQVRGLEMVTSTGDLVQLHPSDGQDSFAGSVISLGSLGVVVSLTLNITRTYEISQVVYEDVSFELALAQLDAIFAAGYSVSLFTTWTQPVFDQVWVKTLAATAPTDGKPSWVQGSRLAGSARHPLPTLPGDVCTTQLGIAGPWHERLPHFRLDFTPSSGDELQSEFFVGRHNAVAALRSLDEIRTQIAPLLLISELRSVAGDDLWLSPAYGRPSMAIHFTWKPDAVAITPVLAMLEERLMQFAARPHWGKVFSLDPTYVAAQYPRMSDACALASTYDPAHTFVNDFVGTYLRS